MYLIIKYLTIVSLILAPTFCSFIDFKQDFEYNLHFNFATIVERHSNITAPLTTIFEASLQLQKVTKNQLLCKIYDITTDKNEYKEITKPFLVMMNGTRIGSITFSSIWEQAEILQVQGLIKAITWDRSDITRYLDSKNWEDKISIVNLPMGKCDSDIEISLNDKKMSILAKSTKKRCIVTDEERRILGDHINFVDESSDTLVRLTYPRGIWTPEKIDVKLRMRFPSEDGDGFADMTGQVTAVLLNTKEIDSRIEVEEKVKTMSIEEILDLNQAYH